MKRNIIWTFVILITLTSCDSMRRTIRESYQYELYIDFKNVSYQGRNSTQQLYLEIDSTSGIWFDGKLVINKMDTFMIHGFEKGNHYVTTYKIPRTNDYGRLEIWCSDETGQIRDSLTIADRNLTSGIVKEKTVLFRQPRIICQ
jgi:hypothetical protein